jgi:D-alanyl-D-alanine carboxypeptidase
MGGAIVDSTGLRAVAVVGVRKKGETTEATPEDLWHLGSDTKAMTATMIAALIEQGSCPGIRRSAAPSRILSCRMR